MVNEQLTHYIETVQSQGYSESTIRDVLAKNGWQPHDIDEAFSYVKLTNNTLSANAPVAPANFGAVSNNTAKAEEVTNQSYGEFVHTGPEYNSPFSVGLAIVLVAAIMILLNKVIDDASYYTNTINSQLIFDVLIVIPFILIAFILHESFINTGKRFLLVSQPYFLVSAALLVRLLWDTSKYILNTSATYGVYIVLILIILVLTGSILFVQKYIKA
ncbi:MAG: hypothetical protein KGI58_03345 [Patescibacteria group bacterium]|nr:hypothetical protein [Patescibacteria group bacterium]